MPRAFHPCSTCGEDTPASNLFRPAPDAPSACSTCLYEGYALFTQLLELRERRGAYHPSASGTAASVLRAHFDGYDTGDIVSAVKTFPAYLRADVQMSLDRQLDGESSRCVGLHVSFSGDTTRFASLLESRRDPAMVVPLRFDEIDVGTDVPLRCLRLALWFSRTKGVPWAVLLSPEDRYGQNKGWSVEVAVPVGDAGERISTSFFQQLEADVERSASYRGKVLSLECRPGYSGASAGNVVVHRLDPVAAADIVLPERTLALLERNVFGFFEHRGRLAELGLPLRKGLLFYGPPGTGKTHAIRYLAGRLTEHTTLLVTAEQVTIIHEYTALARLLRPAIVVIEDVDLIARDRSTLETAVQESLLNRLLNEMDGLQENAEVLFVLTTNRPEALESALTGRPGRVDQAIEFPLPDDEGRRQLVALYGKGLQVPEALAQDIVERTRGVSASFIKELMRRTAQFACERDVRATEATAADVEGALRELLFEGGSLNARLLGLADPPG